MGVIAVTGATGYVGRFVVAELQRQGEAIRALSRSGSNRGGFAGEIEWVDGNLSDLDALRRLTEHADAVIHLAYEHVSGRYRGGEGHDLAGWIDANVNGSLRLLMAARAANVGRFIFLSSRAVFSQIEPGRALDESHPTSPDTHYGAYKVAVEAFLRSFASTGNMKTASLRATGVYGLTWPVERSKWWGLIQALLADQPITAAGGGTEVHGADVARVVTDLLRRDDYTFDIIHLSDLFVTDHDVVRLARAYANQPGELPPLPAHPPKNVLVCRRLQELGITLGGQALLEETIAELVRAGQT
jgi:nucleoside-diphosphate-sugar epimerase